MSVTGTGTLSIRKQDLANSKKGAIGFQQLVAAHQATAGATGFNINSLTPPPDMVAAGFVQPSLSQIAAAKMLFNRKNLKLISSAKGELVDFLSYFVTTNNQIVFNGWTAEADEIFTIIINNAPISGAQVVDAVALNATGTLLTGTTDFNVGTPYEVGKYINTQMGAVLVFVNGVLQFRNVGNVTAAPGADGNYQEVNPGGGLGTIIRFNQTFPNEVPVVVIGNGLLVNQPTDTQNSVIQNLAGSLDSVISTVAVLAGVPTTNFKASPSNIDLKAFGDRVLTLETASSSYGSLRLNTANGYGSPATRIRRFTNVVFNQGSGFTYADSASLGATVTITANGIYSFSYTDEFSVDASMGLTKNVTAGEAAGNVVSVPVAKRLAVVSSSAASRMAEASWTGYLVIGDVVTPHADASTSSGSPDRASFSVQRLSLN